MNGNYQQPYPNNSAPQPQKPPFYKNWIFWLVIGVSAAVMTLLILLFVLVFQWLSLMGTAVDKVGDVYSAVLEEYGDVLEESGYDTEQIRDELQEALEDRDVDINEFLTDFTEAYGDGQIDQQEIQGLLDKYGVEMEE